MELMGAMADVLGTWALAFVMFAGLGLLSRWLLGLSSVSARDVFGAAWVGLSLAITFLQIWNFS